MKKLPTFTLARRTGLERDAERSARQGLADLVRLAARADNQARLLVMHDHRRRIEAAATIGSALAKLDVRGWRRALLTLGIKDSDFLERCEKLSHEQLRRFVSEEAPAAVLHAEAVARAIETQHVAVSDVAEDETPPDAPPSPVVDVAARPTRWG